jgi:hypothetical protein
MREDEIDLAKKLTVRSKEGRDAWFVRTQRGTNHVYSLTEAGMNLARSYKGDLIDPTTTEASLLAALDARDDAYYNKRRVIDSPHRP